MISFENNKLNNLELPMNIVRMLTTIHEYKGKQDLYKKQPSKILRGFKEVARVQSVESSNRIEGICTPNKRLHGIISNKIELRDNSEKEIAGYRDVLNIIDSDFESIPITPAALLELHKELYKFTEGNVGIYKTSNNVIEEILPDGSSCIKFKTVDFSCTPSYMEKLCEEYKKQIGKEEVEPLVLISVFILDFLCIHPFNNANGRMARLLTLLLLYQNGFEVGEFISLDKIIEESKETYYESLNKSSMLWHDGKNNLYIWLEYFLGTIIRAYKELEDRVSCIQPVRGGKSERLENAIEGKLGYFTKGEIRAICPDIGEATINRVFGKLKEDGVIEPIGKGRNAKWKKIK